MSNKTRGELQAEFSKAIVQFEKDYLGRGPLEVRTFFVEDMVVVRIRGVLTRAEQKLAESEDGKTLVKETRRQLFESLRPELEEMVQGILDCEMVSLHSDISTTTGERIVVLTVDKPLGKI
ncbi:MAG: DUF2294 domain-containing protein [Chloroflexi bacterium]|nr:MAG: DUF2294 domain-containing protein [Chloroflexota bacterium]MBL1196740.1 DUF2294 domain-containing protein [Chloroflexota bacterium]NOH14034.1 DUF2294 domain-containing protein [Chloroflexota bacterium]